MNTKTSARFRASKLLRRLLVHRWLFVVPIAVGCFAPLCPANASPDPDYVNAALRNTADGTDALFYEYSGVDNTAIGYRALYFDQVGSRNTAVGSGALINQGQPYGTAAATDNTAVGASALETNSAGSFNSAFGSGALKSSTGSRNTGLGYLAADSAGAISDNTAVGYLALIYTQSGSGQNTAIGSQALQGNPNYGTNSVSFNTATGFQSLRLITTGGFNVANGWQALYSNSSGAQNTATGASALHNNTTGASNTATGASALRSNVSGVSNTAVGTRALYRNTTNFNTAVGANAMDATQTGYSNTAVGEKSLYSNVSGYLNAAVGGQALYLNNTGHDNTGLGINSLHQNVSGFGNTATGDSALYNATGSNNVGLGYQAGQNLTTGSGDVCIGAGVVGVAGESNTTRIRNVYSSLASGRAVYVNADNKIGTLSSSRRYKDEIKPMDNASEPILALNPVTFRYKKEIDPAQALSFGLVAEEVAKIDPALVTRDTEGTPETVRYEAINAMLLNEFLKEHKRVQDLRDSDAEQKKQIAAQAAEISTLKSTIAQEQKLTDALAAQVKEQAAELQKVTAIVALKGSTPQTVVTNH